MLQENKKLQKQLDKHVTQIKLETLDYKLEGLKVTDLIETGKTFFEYHTKYGILKLQIISNVIEWIGYSYQPEEIYWWVKGDNE